MQALVDVALCGVVTLTHYKLDENELHLTEKNEKMIEKDEYGVMVNMCLVFLNCKRRFPSYKIRRENYPDFTS